MPQPRAIWEWQILGICSYCRDTRALQACRQGWRDEQRCIWGSTGCNSQMLGEGWGPQGFNGAIQDPSSLPWPGSLRDAVRNVTLFPPGALAVLPLCRPDSVFPLCPGTSSMVGATPSLPSALAASRVGLGSRRHSRGVLGGWGCHTMGYGVEKQGRRLCLP